MAFGLARRRSSMCGLIWPFATLGFDAVRRRLGRFGGERYHGVTTQPSFRPSAIGGDDESRALSTLGLIAPTAFMSSTGREHRMVTERCVRAQRPRRSALVGKATTALVARVPTVICGLRDRWWWCGPVRRFGGWARDTRRRWLPARKRSSMYSVVVGSGRPPGALGSRRFIP
jgi:hypothetical protein